MEYRKEKSVERRLLTLALERLTLFFGHKIVNVKSIVNVRRRDT